MKRPNQSAPAARALAKRVVSLIALSTMLASQAAQAFTISNLPVFLPTPPPPNIVVTLDDSGSMRWGYAPDALCVTHNTRRAKSSDFNPIYYNPQLRYDPPPRADGTLLSTSFTQAWINGFAPGRGSVDLATSYRVTWAYNPADTLATVDGANQWNQCGGSATNNNYAEHPSSDFGTTPAGNLTRAGVPAYYYVYTPTTGCTKTNDDCYSLRAVGGQPGPADLNGDGVINGDDERQNFANWYSFYRTRNLLTVAAAAAAFQDPTLSGTRIAWQSLNSCNNSFTSNPATCRGWDTGVAAQIRRMRAFDDTHRANMYNWLFRLPANGGTPLRAAMQRAGDYYRSSVASNALNTPYAFRPNPVDGEKTGDRVELSCRPNFHILMTDGIWNEGDANFCAGTNCGNKDGTSMTLPDGTSYSDSSAQTAIYRDGASNALADVAFHYWATDLRTDLNNNVLKYEPSGKDVTAGSTTITPYWNPRNDPATWQHMVTFTVGLGLSSTLTVNTPVDLTWTGSTWGPGGGYENLLSGAGTWPTAASNVSPANVYDLWHAAINSRGQSFAADNPRQLGVALKTSLNRVLSRSSGAASATVNSTRISSDSLLFQALLNSADWSGQVRAFAIINNGEVGPQQWSTNEPGKIPNWDVRQNHVLTWSGTAGVPFTKAGMDDAASATDAWSKIALTPAPASASTVAVEEDDILRYVLGDKSKELEATNGIYRNRSAPLGDIVNSDPVLVGAERYSYAALPEGGPSAASPYLDFVAKKAKRRPMLYVGSNGGMLHGLDAKTGVETFAYVPGAVLGNLAQLADPNYSHRYFVDGTPTASDAFFKRADETAPDWKTVLLGTTGAGGAGVFAIDVTNPDAMGPNNILWEINTSTAFRSGVDAADPRYDVDLGATINEVTIGRMNDGEWVAVFGNGYRSANNRAVLYIVRLSDGALIRKFDTGVGSGATPNGLGTPLLVDADKNQTIDYIYAGDMRGNVWKFDVRNTSSGSWQFAYSGQPFFQALTSGGVPQPISARLRTAPAPASTTGRMIVFGTGRLWAVNDILDTTTQTFYGLLDNDGTRITGRGSLQQQTVTSQTLDQRFISNNTVNWLAQRGWYLDLPDSRERVVGPARVRSERVIFTSAVPTDDPCEFGGWSWLMQLNAQTGQTLNTQVFDINGDNLVNINDSLASGVQLRGLVRQSALIENTFLASGTAGTDPQRRQTQFADETGRGAWREVIQ